MILILCECYEDAEWAFEIFSEYLDFEQPGTIMEMNPYRCEILTDCDLRYLFIDYHYIDQFGDLSKYDCIGVDEFLSDMDSDYKIYFWGGKNVKKIII